MQRHPRVLIYGHGFIGQKMLGAFTNVVLGSADIARRRELDSELERLQPDVVINCAGRTGFPNIDWCERHRRSTWYSNAVGAQTLGAACQHNRVFLVHLSSGCMFHSETPGQVWRETDRPRAFNFYTESKLFAEQRLNADHTAIVRIRLPLDTTLHSRNLLSKLIRFTVVSMALNSVTVLDDLISAVKTIIKHRATGVFHCVSPQPTSLSTIKSLMREHDLASEHFAKVAASDLVRLGLVKTKRSDAILGIDRLLDLGFSPQATQLAVERAVAQFAHRWHSLTRRQELTHAS